MRKLQALAVSVGAVFVLAVAPVAFVAADQTNPQLGADQTAAKALTAAPAAAALTDCKRQSAANGLGQNIFLSTPSPKTYTGTTWQYVDCTTTTFRLAYNQRALVTLNFNAEADCNGNTDTNTQWCQTRAVLGGTGLVLTEGAPVAAEPSSFAFDSAKGGSLNWQAHSMARAWEVRCATQTGCQYRIGVQTRNHDASITGGLWLDDLATNVVLTYGNPAPL